MFWQVFLFKDSKLNERLLELRSQLLGMQIHNKLLDHLDVFGFDLHQLLNLVRLLALSRLCCRLTFWWIVHMPFLATFFLHLFYHKVFWHWLLYDSFINKVMLIKLYTINKNAMHNLKKFILINFISILNRRSIVLT